MRYKLGLVVLLFAAVCFLHPDLREEVSGFYWRAEGRREAERDIAAGTMKIKLFGHMAGMGRKDKAYARLMRERFGVEVKVIGFCIMEESEVQRAGGYNDRIHRELVSKFGEEAIEGVSVELAAVKD